MTQDPYKVLGVSPDATDDEIKQAYRRLAKKYHPDRNPGDPVAAQKMQEINDAYDRIKNPGKTYSAGGGYGGYGNYGGYGYGDWQQSTDGTSSYQRAAEQYIYFGRYHEALNVLNSVTERTARWYYLSAVANDGLGNQITALEHIQKAIDMEPGNIMYQRMREQIESGETTYRRQAGNFGGFDMRGGLWRLCMCYFMQLFCCGRRFFCC